MTVLKVILSLSLISFLVSCSTQKAASKKLDPIIESEIDQQQIPGIAITVIKNRDVVFSKGYGEANILRKTAVSPDETLFRIASISKPMTSAILSRLMQDGILHIDSSVYFYADNFPRKRHDFSIRQVGGHVAGIRTYEGNEFYSDTFYSKVYDALSIFSEDSINFEPGTQYAYSSYGWNLLSYIVEKASDQPFLKIMQDSVFDIMRLNHTHPSDHFEVGRDQYRTGYYKDLNDTIADEPMVDLSNKWAGGGFESTSEDVALFADTFWFGNFVSDSIRNLFIEPIMLNNGTSTNYGVGWSKNTDGNGRIYYGHAGSGVGASAMLVVYPKNKLVIVVLTNKSKASLEPIYSKLADYFLQTE